MKAKLTLPICLGLTVIVCFTQSAAGAGILVGVLSPPGKLQQIAKATFEKQHYKVLKVESSFKGTLYTKGQSVKRLYVLSISSVVDEGKERVYSEAINLRSRLTEFFEICASAESEIQETINSAIYNIENDGNRSLSCREVTVSLRRETLTEIRLYPLFFGLKKAFVDNPRIGFINEGSNQAVLSLQDDIQSGVAGYPLKKSPFEQVCLIDIACYLAPNPSDGIIIQMINVRNQSVVGQKRIYNFYDIGDIVSQIIALAPKH